MINFYPKNNIEGAKDSLRRLFGSDYNVDDHVLKISNSLLKKKKLDVKGENKSIKVWSMEKYKTDPCFIHRSGATVWIFGGSVSMAIQKNRISQLFAKPSLRYKKSLKERRITEDINGSPLRSWLSGWSQMYVLMFNSNPVNCLIFFPE